VNDEEGRQKVLCTGADLIVVKGLPGGKLVTEIEKFLCPDRLDSSLKKDSVGEKVERKKEV
jgi:hypothetical protein